MRAFQVSLLMASPAHLQNLMKAGAANSSYPSLRRLIMGGSRVQASMVQAAQCVFTTQVWVGYGSTEVGPMAGGLPAVLRGQDGAVGRIAPWARVDILDNDEQPVAPGREGVVRIKSSVMGRYLNTDGDSAIRGEYFYPGDVGIIRGDGVLVITGRTDDIINAGGAKIAPELLEEVLLKHPAVRDAAVFAAPGAHGADRVHAVVVRGAGDVGEAELLAYCRERISQGAPVSIEWIDAIPRNDNGKVVRHALRSRFLNTLS
jgi:acyl-coenzyme A synthetase/AMP-(fatty) acid ligase